VVRNDSRLRAVFALLAALVLALGIAACGDDDDDGDGGGDTSANLIESNPDNSGIELTVGSKNFTEQLILGEIYAQALEAAGYSVQTDLNLGSEQVALEALEAGEISGSRVHLDGSDLVLRPRAGRRARRRGRGDRAVPVRIRAEGPGGVPARPVLQRECGGAAQETADELGVTTVSDLEGISQDLTLFGSPECRQRVDCLVGLEDGYGLQFKSFTPVDIEQRYPVLDSARPICPSCSPRIRSSRRRPTST
jgi:osmoprotectant transport system substrate-binding protein